jgi:hypothetical protein
MQMGESAMWRWVRVVGGENEMEGGAKEVYQPIFSPPPL